MCDSQSDRVPGNVRQSSRHIHSGVPGVRQYSTDLKPNRVPRHSRTGDPHRDDGEEGGNFNF